MNEDKFKCGCSKKECRKELAECKDWEVNKKKKLEKALANNRSPYCLNPDGWEKEEGKTVCTRMGSKILPPTAFCQDCQKQIGNEYGDIMPHLETDCLKDKNIINNINREREREREQNHPTRNPNQAIRTNC